MKFIITCMVDARNEDEALDLAHTLSDGTNYSVQRVFETREEELAYDKACLEDEAIDQAVEVSRGQE